MVYPRLIGWRGTAAALVSTSLAYYLNIFYDHDQRETEANRRPRYDSWADRQIVESGNVPYSVPWTLFWGGINYQIEHHLFPSVHPAHYPRIAPIVRRFAEERGLPYVSNTWTHALAGYLK